MTKPSLRTLLLVPCIAGLVLTGSCEPAPEVVEADLALVGVNVVPMDVPGVLPDRTIFVRDGRIARITRSDEAVPAEGATVVQGAGRYVAPGLVDAHAHARAVGVFDLYLSYGVTTVRLMHGGLGDPLAWAREIEAGTLRAPNLVLASPILQWNTPGLTLPGWEPLDSFDDIERALQAIRDSGFVSVKILDFPREPFDTLMAVAGRLGLPVTGHLPITETGDPAQDLTFDEVLASGMTVIEHMNEVLTGGLAPAERDSAGIADLASRVARSGVALTTLTDLPRLVRDAVTLDSAFVTPERRAAALKYAGQPGLDQLSRLPAIVRQQGFMGVPADTLGLLIRELHRAGVPLMVGTDSHTAMQVAGDSAIEDMLFLVSSGLDPFDALAAMTSVPARTLGYDEDWGKVTEGVLANLIVLPSNPLDDPAVVYDLEGVVLRGEWLDAAALQAMREEAESRILTCPAPRCE